MQARWGSHGDYPIIVLAPASVREIYTETIRAFDLAETFRTPVDRAVRPGHRAAHRDRRTGRRRRRRAGAAQVGERSARGVPAVRCRCRRHSRHGAARRRLPGAHHRPHSRGRRLSQPASRDREPQPRTAAGQARRASRRHRFLGGAGLRRCRRRGGGDRHQRPRRDPRRRAVPRARPARRAVPSDHAVAVSGACLARSHGARAQRCWCRS